MMTLNTADHLLIIDIEATCWQGDPPPGMVNEIIEVGVCVFGLDDLSIAGSQGILVKPTRSTVSDFCTELTTITQAMAARGVSFAAACEILIKDYGARSISWASWGDYDRKMFQKQCEAAGVPYPFSTVHLNLKTLFAKVHELGKTVGMERALKMLDMPLAGTHHRGVDDALNIAALARRMVEQHGRGVIDDALHIATE